MDLFSFLEVETSSVCNLRCPTCPVSTSPRDSVLLDEEVIRKLVDELACLGYSGVFSPHFYNEPFSDPRLPELLGYACARLPLARMVIFTNATLVTPELLARMPEGIHEYVVTIDNPVIAAAHARLMDAIPGKQAAKFRARSIAGHALSNRGGALTGLAGLAKVRRCPIPEHYCSINACGDVLLCYNDYYGRHVFGNITDAPLMDIWWDPEFVRARREVSAGVFGNRICIDCATNAPELAGT